MSLQIVTLGRNASILRLQRLLRLQLQLQTFFHLAEEEENLYISWD